VSTPSGGLRPADEPAGDTPADDANDAAATDPDAIRAEIEATREQLGRTVDELSNRLDVPARTRERVARTKDTAVETYRESPPVVIGAGVALIGLVIGMIVLRRRRAEARRKR
jgi:ElaB/YqjD/DUF883 family membrane-anchored ribosome-binding protein